MVEYKETVLMCMRLFNATVNKEAKLFSLHKIYPTAILLKKFGKVNSERCKYCEEIDTLEHFLETVMFVK